MSDYTLSVYELAVKLYEETNRVGVPLHHRPATVRDAWVKAAQLQKDQTKH